MTFGSVCDGIGCGHLGFVQAGLSCDWSFEIEAFPSAVLAYRFPSVPNYGDMTACADMIYQGKIEAPDVFIGGTPCQAFSVAGKRKGLEDARGNLSLTFCEIADAIDDVRRGSGKPPCVILWENVPGVLSDKGNAFGCFLGELSGSGCQLQPPGGKWRNAGCVFGPARTVAWRVLDSQFFGVAQRRRRVFVVASAGDWVHPEEILFEREGVRRDTPTRQDTRKGASGYSGKRSTVSGKDVFPTILADCGSKRWLGNQECFSGDYFIGEPAIYENHANDSRIVGPLELSPMLSARMGTGGGNVPLVGPGEPEGDAYKCGGCSHFGRQTVHQTTCPSCGADDYENIMLSPTIGPYAGKVFASCYGRYVDPEKLDNEGQLIEEEETPKAIQFERRMVRTTGGQPSEELCGCLRADENTGDGAPCVAIADVIHGDKDCNGKGWNADGTAYTLDTMATQGVASNMQVRRLTPTECERLQALPDCWTQIPWKGKPSSECPDGPRYKGIGNGQTVSVMRWLAKRIKDAIDNKPISVG